MTPQECVTTASQLVWSLYVSGDLSADQQSAITLGLGVADMALKALGDIPVRIFLLVRDIDLGGVSGTGHVATAVEFEEGGPVVIRWLANENQEPSFSIRVSLADAIKVHGHGGATRFVEVGARRPTGA